MKAAFPFRTRFKAAAVIALFLVIGSLPPARGQDLENRREQARRAFLARPDGLYMQYCAHCHGNDGKGNGRLWAAELSPAPTDLTSLKADKESLIQMIREGSAAQGKSNLCPPWGRTIPADKIQRLAQHLVSLRGPPATTPAADSRTSEADAKLESFPWPWVVVIVLELAILVRMVQRRKKTSRPPEAGSAMRQIQ